MAGPTTGSAPPTYDGLPLLGNAHQVVRDQGAFYERAAREGDVVALSLPGMGEVYQLSHPDVVQRVLRDTDRFRKASMTKDQLGELLGEGLVLSEGETWRSQRQRVQPAFYRDRIAEHADVMVEGARETARNWESRDGPVEVGDEMKALTLRILVRAMFGSDIDYEARGIRETVAALQEPGKPHKQPIAQLVPKWVPIPMWRRYLAAIEDVEDLIQEFVDHHRGGDGGRGRDRDGEDLVSMLLAGTDEAGEGMSDEQVRDELMTFLFAGHETTATALTFTWLLLAEHPAVERRLAAELDSLDGPPSFEDLPELNYTEAVLKEAMRVYPPVPAVPRETSEPVELGGYRIPEGAIVACSQWAIHRDGRFWAYPHEFRPERWLDDAGSAHGGRNEDRPRFAYFPFGGGPRRCIAETFATVEGQLILATLARRFSPQLVGDEPEIAVSVTTRPVDPVRMRMVPR